MTTRKVLSIHRLTRRTNSICSNKVSMAIARLDTDIGRLCTLVRPEFVDVERGLMVYVDNEVTKYMMKVGAIIMSADDFSGCRPG